MVGDAGPHEECGDARRAELRLSDPVGPTTMWRAAGQAARRPRLRVHVQLPGSETTDHGRDLDVAGCVKHIGKLPRRASEILKRRGWPRVHRACLVLLEPRPRNILDSPPHYLRSAESDFCCRGGCDSNC